MKLSLLIPLAALALSGCSAANIAPGTAVSVTATSYQQCATRKTMEAKGEANPVTTAEAACKTELDAYRSTLVAYGMSANDADASTAKLAANTRVAIKAAGIA